MRLALLVIALLAIYVWLASRRQARRIEELNDRLIDWRIRMGRDIEQLQDRLEALGAPRPAGREPAAPAGDPLLQIRRLPGGTPGPGPGSES